MKLINGDAAFRKFRSLINQSWHMSKEAAINCMEVVVRETPAIDAVRVIRCKNCKHYKEADMVKGYFFCDRDGGKVKEEDFCSWAKKRKE